MKNAEVLFWAQPGETGKSRFRDALSGVNDFNVSLQVVINDKRLKEAADAINDTLKGFEPAAVTDLRNRAKGASGEDVNKINLEFNREYNKFWTSLKVQEFLKSESAIELKKCTLPENFEKRLRSSDPDTIEALMVFTDIEGETTEKPKKNGKR